MRTRISFALAAAIIALLFPTAPGLAQSEIEVGPFSAFPTPDITDSRFLSTVSRGSGLDNISTIVGLSIPFGENDFIFRVFDPDTGEPCDPATDPACHPDFASRGHWDEGKTPLCVKLFADPLRTANPEGLTQIASWCSDEGNFTASAPIMAIDPEMNDNEWWDVKMAVTPDAVSPGGAAFYLIELCLDEEQDDGKTVSNFKVAANVPLAVFGSQFGFEAGFGGFFNDLEIVYPDFVFPDSLFDERFFVDAPTTYDGSYTFFLDVSNGLETLTIWDGDFDHGADPDQLEGVPSGETIQACVDDDDPNTPNAKPPFDPLADDEGEAGIGDPADDSNQDFLRRSPCVWYELTDPLGNRYVNSNPSGNREWERFVVSTQDTLYDENGDSYSPDYVVDPEAAPGGLLPTGPWRLRVFGLDLSNSNFWRFDVALCGVLNGEPLCPEEQVVIGDRVWYDYDGDGMQDEGEPGIPGVKLNRVGTSDTTSTVGDGLYLFDVLPGTSEDPGVYTVEVAPENYMEIPTGGVGDRVFLDVPGLPGLPNVTVRLLTATVGECGTASLALTTTDEGGYYWFNGLEAGWYCTQVVESTLPAGLAQSYDPDGVRDGQSATAIDPVGGPATIDSLDYGYELADPGLAALSGRAWLDVDEDGLQDVGEAGIGGARVLLYPCSADPALELPLAWTKTDGGGYYDFGFLEAGCHRVIVVSETLPAGAVSTWDYGTGWVAPDGESEVDLSTGQIEYQVDFGFLNESFCATDVIWNDEDTDGIFDDDEEPIEGVTVTFRGLDFWTVATTESSSDGSFTVCGLQYGLDYMIEIEDRFGALDGLMGTTWPAARGRGNFVIGDQGNFFGEDFGYVRQGWLAECRWTTNPNGNADPNDDVMSSTPTSVTDAIPFDSNGVPGNNLLFDMGCQLFLPGTGTPGYWRNHPEAWPVDEIMLGGVIYSKAEAIEILESATRRDMTLVLASHLIAAKLNVAIGNPSTCIDDAIAGADAWLTEYPIGSVIKAKSDAWKEAEPLSRELDDFNNGLLCAPARE
jgi:hypothetical protein